MLRLLLATTVVLLLVACTDDDPSPAERRAALTEDLAGDLVAETDGALSDEQARCVAEALVQAVGVESFDQIVAAAADEAAADPRTDADPGTDGGPGEAADGDGEPDDGLRLTVIDAFAGCDALEPLLDEPAG